MTGRIDQVGPPISEKPSMIRENGFWVHRGVAPKEFDWNRHIEEQRRGENFMENEKNWEARFQQSRTHWSSIRHVCTKEDAVVAGAYRGLVLLVFVLLQSSGFDMIGDGALPIAALTAPWSFLAIAVGSAAPQVQLHPFISPLGTFIVFPVLCGGLNAVLLTVAWSAIQRRRHRSSYR